MRTSGPRFEAKQTKMRRLAVKFGASWRLIIPASDATSRSSGRQCRTVRPPATIVSPLGRSV